MHLPGCCLVVLSTLMYMLALLTTGWYRPWPATHSFTHAPGDYIPIYSYTVGEGVLLGTVCISNQSSIRMGMGMDDSTQKKKQHGMAFIPAIPTRRSSSSTDVGSPSATLFLFPRPLQPAEGQVSKGDRRRSPAIRPRLLILPFPVRI
ncbi:hypothetical protein BO70DRAFT_215641 [Aspergillus heteromorphus CBS 117.55]|uniref:Uncharacterized protein n=1 Tax=Aspergillus heteromorphus CBS 117.55 TaxID=1448321 RepID=A0A317WKV1_9EURO|nr:uncharacterized protein BO70DRAFT_215641 [Aspergillus heteromorphus CBS 117.55]PWY87013.1 hypothetical protein BO70DRAFT_215641 [Aspergillus heteromorphus CBS 117.55]